MIITTTPTVESHPVEEYLGIVTGEAILGAHIGRDFLASITDIIGGRSKAYEEEVRKARDIALEEMASEAASKGANAVVGVDIDYEVIRQGMLMVISATDLRTKTREIRDWVRINGEPVIVEYFGQPELMIVDAQEAETWERFRAQERELARRSLRQLLDDVAERNVDIPLEEVETIVAEAVAAVRTERRQQQVGNRDATRRD
jgi:uncharacterized protein YbjQ (UPF0145 family)